MDTKSEDSDFREADTTPLTDDERALLDRLRDGDGGGAPAAEESPEYAVAVDEDSPVPTEPRTGPADPLDPVFQEPAS